MPKKGEIHETSYWEIDFDEETGKPFWRGAGADDKDETIFDAEQPLTMDPKHFPPGTRISVEEPWDEEFYTKLFAEREKAQPPADGER